MLSLQAPHGLVQCSKAAHSQTPKSYRITCCCQAGLRGFGHTLQQTLINSRRCSQPHSIADEEAQLAATCDADVYPKFETDGPQDGLFPVRQPGTFPRLELEAEAPAEEEYDPLRDGPLRYLGYSNECGEAFAAWIPVWGVPFSYAVAVSYVLVDTFDKGVRAYKEAKEELDTEAEAAAGVDVPKLTRLLAFDRALDTVVWQLLASVIIPGYTIHTIVALAHAGLLPLEDTETMKAAFETSATTFSTTPSVLLGLFDKTLPTLVGLGAIPFIVHPIDNGVHAILNATMRPAMKKYICSTGLGAIAGLAMCNDDQCSAEGKL